jgi:pimeloyl-ACP methyl ester carboxylesterase
MAASADLKTIHHFLQANEMQTKGGGVVKSFSHDNGDDVVLCMVHGYPQSSFMWRHVSLPFPFLLGIWKLWPVRLR